jgi:hypothetical protein
MFAAGRNDVIPREKQTQKVMLTIFSQRSV